VMIASIGMRKNALAIAAISFLRVLFRSVATATTIAANVTPGVGRVNRQISRESRGRWLGRCLG
jgi:hypothetical protein